MPENAISSEYKRECVLNQFGQVMHIESQIFLKYFKSEAKSLSRSSKLNFNIYNNKFGQDFVL